MFISITRIYTQYTHYVDRSHTHINGRVHVSFYGRNRYIYRRVFGVSNTRANDKIRPRLRVQPWGLELFFILSRERGRSHVGGCERGINYTMSPRRTDILYGYRRDGWGESRCRAFVTVGSKATGGLSAMRPGTTAPLLGKTRGI